MKVSQTVTLDGNDQRPPANRVTLPSLTAHTLAEGCGHHLFSSLAEVALAGTQHDYTRLATGGTRSTAATTGSNREAYHQAHVGPSAISRPNTARPSPGRTTWGSPRLARGRAAACSELALHLQELIEERTGTGRGQTAVGSPGGLRSRIKQP